MPYNIHITRAESYWEDDSPITLAEIEHILSPLPRGFSIERSGIVSTAAPRGETLSTDIGPYLIYEDKEDPGSRIHIYFDRETGPWFSVREDKRLLPILELSESLRAELQGDEGEVYTKDAILNP